jgi:hypothetical protein
LREEERGAGVPRPIVAGDVLIGDGVHCIAEVPIGRDAPREVVRSENDGVLHDLGGDLIGRDVRRLVQRVALDANATQGHALEQAIGVRIQPFREERREYLRVETEREAERRDVDAVIVDLANEQIVGRHVDGFAPERGLDAVFSCNERHGERDFGRHEHRSVGDDRFGHDLAARLGDRLVELCVPRDGAGNNRARD